MLTNQRPITSYAPPPTTGPQLPTVQSVRTLTWKELCRVSDYRFSYLRVFPELASFCDSVIHYSVQQLQNLFLTFITIDLYYRSSQWWIVMNVRNSRHTLNHKLARVLEILTPLVHPNTKIHVQNYCVKLLNDFFFIIWRISSKLAASLLLGRICRYREMAPLTHVYADRVIVCRNLLPSSEATGTKQARQ